jgi:hypothetical protein
MCNPAIIIGAATAVMGSLQSIAGYQQQQAQYQYEQQVAQTQYQYQMQAYGESQRAYQEQIKANEAAANRAYIAEQRKLETDYAKAAQDAQQLMIDKLKTQGQILSSGRTGKSIALLASDAEREYGRDLANLGTNLGYAREAYTLAGLDIEADARSANAQAASNRLIQPLTPIAGPAPSAAGAVLGIGQAALGGYSMYQGLKAPSGFVNPPASGSQVKMPSSTKVDTRTAFSLPKLAG